LRRRHDGGLGGIGRRWKARAGRHRPRNGAASGLRHAQNPRRKSLLPVGSLRARTRRNPQAVTLSARSKTVSLFRKPGFAVRRLLTTFCNTSPDCRRQNHMAHRAAKIYLPTREEPIRRSAPERAEARPAFRDFTQPWLDLNDKSVL